MVVLPRPVLFSVRNAAVSSNIAVPCSQNQRRGQENSHTIIRLIVNAPIKHFTDEFNGNGDGII